MNKNILGFIVVEHYTDSAGRDLVTYSKELIPDYDMACARVLHYRSIRNRFWHFTLLPVVASEEISVYQRDNS